jgi:hypothetical protein
MEPRQSTNAFNINNIHDTSNRNSLTIRNSKTKHAERATEEKCREIFQELCNINGNKINNNIIKIT